MLADGFHINQTKNGIWVRQNAMVPNSIICITNRTKLDSSDWIFWMNFNQTEIRFYNPNEFEFRYAAQWLFNISSIRQNQCLKCFCTLRYIKANTVSAKSTLESVLWALTSIQSFRLLYTHSSLVWWLFRWWLCSHLIFNIYITRNLFNHQPPLSPPPGTMHPTIWTAYGCRGGWHRIGILIST